MKLILSLLLSILTFEMQSQEKNYFYEIKKFEENYSNRAVISRFLHSVGFRYYWATEGLNENDLIYKPSESGINSRETLEHIYGLSIMIKNGFHNKPIIRSRSYPDLSYLELRNKTLLNIKSSIDLLKEYNESDFENNKVIFGDLKFDLFNLFHGPISDSLYHIGQIVVFRRASGNPIPKGVNHFMGIKM
ncbi:MAG: hypothetical protein CMB90_04315 [Flammeovirgaceae bacterium]|nr:hypothetical protein [Flammeovirgaceae bacterium]|tara:strand:+ start:2662 stop:3231 length:570 start_codon:yes stop_codon:yes gene_type:complete